MKPLEQTPEAQLKQAIRWIEDVRTMMTTPGCGWTDASDSLNLAKRHVAHALSLLEAK